MHVAFAHSERCGQWPWILPVNTAALFPSSQAEDDIVDVTELTVTQFLEEEVAVFAGLLQTLEGDLIPGASGRGTEHF